ncbi:sushi domain-containing protein 6 [Polypterus senegalus]|uniref:sushi domain-containing protein 6 n=1 Tax=Polypterus senegalus TaxID=55291 RepID=UPI0019629F2D|nr:sushi domain-containing protein 6 [Polypterus senegalus]XP_039624182.1 sushi domain-containing protein 6 [Polypterus senegalus]
MMTRRTPVMVCFHSVVYSALLMLTPINNTTAAPSNQTSAASQRCSHPPVPEHGGFRCVPSPCNGFFHKRIVEYFCETGRTIQGNKSALCKNGRWMPSTPGTCNPDPNYEDKNSESNHLPTVATTAVAVSVFLLTTTACMLVKPKIRACRCERRFSDQQSLMFNGSPVLLPSYEVAVFGEGAGSACSNPTHHLQRNLLESTALGPPSNQSLDLPPPPPYEAIAPHPIHEQGSSIPISAANEKDT